MYHYQAQIGQNLSNRKPQPSSESNLTKTARVSLLNFKSKITELKTLYIVTVPYQGPPTIPISLTICLRTCVPNEEMEMGTFAFLEQPSQNRRPLDAFDLYSVSKEGQSFLFIRLKPNYYFSQINIDEDSNRPNFRFSHIEFPSICFKTPEKFSRYFDAISQSVLQNKFCPQDYIYSIKTDRISLFREEDLVSTLINLQKNPTRKLTYNVTYKSTPSQRSTEENSSEEERRTPQNKDRSQNNRNNQFEALNESRVSTQEFRGRGRTSGINMHQGTGSSSSNAHPVRPKPPERENEKYNQRANIDHSNRINSISNQVLSGPQENLKMNNPYQPNPISRHHHLVQNRPDSRENRFSNPENHQRSNSSNKHNSVAQGQPSHFRGNSEPRTNKVEQSGPPVVNNYVLNRLQQKNFKMPVGLRNIGNSCFMNAILSSLFKTPGFAHYFMNKEFLKDKRNKEKEGLVDIFAKVLASVQNPNQQASSYTELRKLETLVGKTNPTFLMYGQHDAYEFFKGLLEGINTELNRVTNPATYKPLKVDLRFPLQTSSDEWFEYLKKRENSIVSDIFGGQLMNETTCLNCSHRKVSFEPFWDLSLSFQKTSKVEEKQYLEEMLFNFLRAHEISDLAFCDNCHRQTRTKMRHAIWRLPKILVFHLRRFEGGNGIYRKLHTEAAFPVRDLNMTSFTQESTDKSVRSARYSLFSIVHHHGKNLTSGHYTAKCLNPDDKEWYRFDDSNVDESRIDIDESSSKLACMLFYARK